MQTSLFVLTLVAALGSGVIGGVFFGFSTFVMRALARIPAAQGIAAMQSINVVVLNGWFLGVFLGTAAACAVAILVALLRWQAPGSGYLLVGGLLYLVGTLLVTMVCNVPRNDALAAVVPTAPERGRRLGGLRRELDLLESRAHRRRHRRGDSFHAGPPRWTGALLVTLIHR